MNVEARLDALADRLWGELCRQHGASGLERVAELLAGFAGRRGPPATAPHQEVNPRLHVPGLSAQPWHLAGDFPEAAALTRHFPLLRREALALLSARAGPSSPMRGERARDGGVLTGAWQTFYFYKDFRHLPAGVRCPVTDAVLAGMQISREAMFSVLHPATTVHDHSDGVNFILSLYLPLIVPPGSWIRFGGETRAWQEGTCMAVDSSFVHQSCNPTDQPRVILIVDLWHHALTPAERAALAWAVPQMDAALRWASGRNA